MKAIILAAGYGNRMRPLTDDTHKTLLKIAGQPIIDRILTGLAENGISEIVLVTGYRSGELESHVMARHPGMNFTFVRNERFRETNNIYSMALAFEQAEIDDDILLIESDLIYEPAVIRKIIDSPYENVALVDRYRTGMDGTVVSLAGDRIISVIPGHLQDENFAFSDKFKTLNIYKFSREFCKTKFSKILTYYAKVIDDNCYYELILGVLIYMQQVSINAEIIENEKWAEVDDANDLRVAEYIFSPESRRSLLEKSMGGYWSVDTLDFCFIRNMYFPNSSMLSELKNNLPKLLQNYGSTQSILNQKLAFFLLCDSENVTVLNGLSQVYPLLRARFAGKTALIPGPTFGEYLVIADKIMTYADVFGADASELADKIPSADIIVVVNPNNPSGSSIDSAYVLQLAGKYPDKTFIVDESFIEFSHQIPMQQLLAEKPLPNVLVLRSLSKSLGVPGLRLGYAYSHDQAFNTWLNSQVPVWNLNSMAEHFLEIILKHRKSLAESIETTKADRAQLISGLRQCNRFERVSDSQGNFVMASISNKDAAQELVGHLLKSENIFVKNLSSKYREPQGFLRFAVRTPAENAHLLEAIRRMPVRA